MLKLYKVTDLRRKNHSGSGFRREKMGESKIPFRTNLDQKVGPFKKRTEGSKTGFSKPIKATRVDDAKEKTNRIRWVLKWVVFLPLSVYALLWLLLLLIDLFKD